MLAFINFQAFLDSLQYMGFGLVGIFGIIGILILLVKLLNKVFPKKEEKDKK